MAKSTNPPDNRGLLISPATDFETINAGNQKSGSLVVANLTSNQLTVNLSIKQFSVNDFSYTYNFTPPNNNWIVLGLTQVVLAPQQSQTINYSINVPSGTKPGGNYFTFLASAALTTGNINSTAQAASLLYLTVNGKLTYTSKLVSASIQRVVFGPQLSYRFNVINTGNVYFFIYVSGKLHGPTARPSLTPYTHLVIPGKIRQLTGTIPHPVLPGIYRAVYGYTTDTGVTVEQARFIVYIPPWSIALILILLLAVNLWYVKKK